MTDPTDAARWRPYSHRQKAETAGRWVVEHGPVLVWNGRTARTLPVQMQWRDGDAAYTALIECVDTLNKARDLASNVLATYATDLDASADHTVALIDLLLTGDAS